MSFNSMRHSEKKKKDLEMLLKMLPDNMVGVEIGSYAGESAEIFAASGKFKQLICVDPWDIKYYTGDQLKFAEENFGKISEKYPLIQKNKMTSDEFFSQPELPKADFVYIDGNHRYEFVKRDILNAKKLLETSGGLKILAGHDYGFHKSPGVKIAVKEILEYPDAKFCYYSWVKFL